ncbi:MAG: iron ABC transporter permease [Burkholderiaceae bacterium]
MPLVHIHRTQAAIVFIALVALALGLALPWTLEQGIDLPVLRDLRAPRVAAGACVGALLALSGLALQVLLRNPLADPYVLGTSSGAAVGGIVALLLGGLMWLGAALGALAAGALLMLLARGAITTRSDDASSRLILTGAMLAAVLGAVSTLLLTLTPDARLRGAIFWLVGDLSGAEVNWPASLFALFFIACYAHYARAIDRLMLGSEAAHLLGEPVARLRTALLVLACIATALAVSMAGSIGFVGLVVPQALRLAGVRGTRHLAWMSALGGAALLVLADTLARSVAWPLELPVGAVMSLIGAPVFIWFLARKHDGAGL